MCFWALPVVSVVLCYALLFNTTSNKITSNLNVVRRKPYYYHYNIININNINIISLEMVFFPLKVLVDITYRATCK